MKKTIFIIFCIAVSAVLCLSAFADTSSDKQFTDVKAGEWYTDSVSYCYSRGYMKGVSSDTFGVNSNVTRAQFATIICSVDNSCKSGFGTGKVFNDVPANQLYTVSVEWAKHFSIVSGVSEASFSPDAPITREALVLMLYKYASISGIDISTSAEIDSFKDSDTVSAWAQTAVKWAVANELLSGYNGNLNPRNNATRAQIAVIVRAFMNLSPKQSASTYTVSRAFSDNMIIQRNEKLTVWGFAPESENGKIVRATFRGKTAVGTVENGEWKAVFDGVFAASTDYNSIKTYGKIKSYSFDDVMTGDVYYVMGQSNIYWSMQLLVIDLTVNNKLDTLEYDYSDARNIRFFRNSTGYYNTLTGEDMPGTVKLFKDVKYKDAHWMKPSDSDIPNFSAIGYLMAYNLSKETDVPIGVIEIDASGCPITTFAPNELADKWHSDTNYMGTGVHYFTLGDTVYPIASRCAYNQQLYPLINFSCAGIVWYQGESDCNNTIDNFGSKVYTFQNEFVDLMTYFRSHFGNSDFPVYMIEFPPCYGYYTSAFLPTGTVRSELGVIPTLLDDSYVVPSSDFWPIDYMHCDNNIHPFCKGYQAKRLSEMISAKEYGNGDVDYVFGPVFDGIEYTNDNTAVIRFKYVGDGLDFDNEEGTDIITGFQILAEGEWKQTFNVEITEKNEVTVKSNSKLEGVRYNGQTDYYSPDTCNMYNSAKVPMVAFASYRFK